MASTTSDPAALTPEQLRIIDQARQRLDQLTKSIEAARHAVMIGRPMPDLKALQSHSAILVQTTSSITSHITSHADLLSTLVAYPSTNFPGRTQEGLAGHLLRKKLEPNVEGWVDEGRAVGQEALRIEAEETKGKISDGGEEQGGRTGLEAEWYAAAAWTAGEAKRFMEESEQRGDDLDDEDEDEDENGDDDVEMGGQKEAGEGKDGGVGGKAEPSRPEMSVVQMARFMNTGIMP